MKVTIKVAGRYSDPDLKAVDLEVGDELETRDWYGKWLVEANLAVLAGDPPPARQAEQNPDDFETASASVADITHLSDLKALPRKTKGKAKAKGK